MVAAGRAVWEDVFFDVDKFAPFTSTRYDGEWLLYVPDQAYEQVTGQEWDRSTRSGGRSSGCRSIGGSARERMGPPRRCAWFHDIGYAPELRDPAFHSSVRAALIYQHLVNGRDQVIAAYVDEQIRKAQDRGG